MTKVRPIDANVLIKRLDAQACEMRTNGEGCANVVEACIEAVIEMPMLGVTVDHKSETKELLAWQFALKVLNDHSKKHPLERMRNLNTMETGDASDAISLIAEQIKRLTKEDKA